MGFHIRCEMSMELKNAPPTLDRRANRNKVTERYKLSRPKQQIKRCGVAQVSADRKCKGLQNEAAP